MPTLEGLLTSLPVAPRRGVVQAPPSSDGPRVTP